MENADWDSIASSRSVIDASLFSRGDYINSPSSISEFWDFFQRFHAAKSKRPKRAADGETNSYNPKHRINFEIIPKRKPAPEDAAVLREAQYALHFFEDFNQRKRLQKAVDIGAAQQVQPPITSARGISHLLCRRCPSQTAATPSSACLLHPTCSWSRATRGAGNQRSCRSTCSCIPSSQHSEFLTPSPLRSCT